MNPIKDLILYQSQNNENISVELLYADEDFFVNTKINVKIIQCRSQYYIK